MKYTDTDRFSWESQVLPTLFAIVQLATFAHQPDNRIAFYFMYVHPPNLPLGSRQSGYE